MIIPIFSHVLPSRRLHYLQNKKTYADLAICRTVHAVAEIYGRPISGGINCTIGTIGNITLLSDRYRHFAEGKQYEEQIQISDGDQCFSGARCFIRVLYHVLQK